MLNNIQEVKRIIVESSNPKIKYLYKRVLKQYNNDLMSFLTKLEPEEKKELLQLIANRIAEISNKISLLAKSKSNSYEISRLNSYLDTLKEYQSILSNDVVLDSNSDALLGNLSLNLFIACPNKENILIDKKNYPIGERNHIRPNLDTINRVINMNFDTNMIHDLEAYFALRKDCDEIEDILNRRKNTLLRLISLKSNLECIEIYQVLITNYFSLKRYYGLQCNRKQALEAELAKYHNKPLKLFNKKKIVSLKQELEDLNKDLIATNNTMINIKNRIDELIESIDNEEFKNIMKFNREILFTLGVLSRISNPFVYENLDITFSDTLSSDSKSDLTYFLGSNLHNINAHNLNEIIAYLKEIIKRYELVFAKKTDKCLECYNNLGTNAKTAIDKEYSYSELAVILKNSEDKYGVKLIDYVTAIKYLSDSEFTIEDVKEIISQDESITWTSDLLVLTNKTLTKN